MQTQSLSTQGLKELLQKVITQKNPGTPTNHAQILIPPETPLHSAIAKEANPTFTTIEVTNEPTAYLQEEVEEKIQPETLPEAHNEGATEEIVNQEITIQEIEIQQFAIQTSEEPHTEITPSIPTQNSLQESIQQKPARIAKLEAKLEEKELQLSALKKSLKELTSKNQAQEKIKSSLEKELEKAKASLTQLSGLKNDLRLQAQEIEQLKETIASLESSLHKARLQSQEQEESLTVKLQTTSLDSQETKMRLVRLISDKKELEDKVTSLSCEKATLAARVQNLTQKCTKFEELEEALNEQIKELTTTLEATTTDLATSQEDLHQMRKTNQELVKQNQQQSLELEQLQETAQTQTIQLLDFEKKNSTLEQALDGLKQSHAQELAVTKACLQEQSHVLDEEQKKLRLLSQEHLFTQKRTEEQENHLRLLEQHLARRVKECALLSKQLEDLMDRTSQLQNSLSINSQKCDQLEDSLETSRKTENALRIELDAQANSLQDQLRAKDEQIHQAQQLLQQKDTELNTLRQMQNRFLELENLVKRSAEIFTAIDTPTISFSHPQAMPYGMLKPPQPTQEQKDIFSFSAPKPQPTSLFE